MTDTFTNCVLSTSVYKLGRFQLIPGNLTFTPCSFCLLSSMGMTEVAQGLKSLGNVTTLSCLWEQVMQVKSHQLCFKEEKVEHGRSWSSPCLVASKLGYWLS